MNASGSLLRLAASVCWVAGAAGGAFAVEIFKANNTLPLNDPQSWESGVAPGAEDVAVFDERVTANSLSFVLAADASWAGVVFTNTAAPTQAMIGTAILATNGTDAATLTLGTNGVCLAGSGLALTLNLPLALSDAQTWQMDRRNLIFGSTVTGTADWTLNTSSQILWNEASGYSGNLIVTNSTNVNRFMKAGRWARSLTVRNSGSQRLEMAFTNAVPWSTLFGDRTATAYCWSGITSGGTLTFEEGDSYYFGSSSFVFDNGFGFQNGGTLTGGILQTGYQDNNVRYTLTNGTIKLSTGVVLGNGLSRLDRDADFRQVGGLVEAQNIQVGWASCKYTGVPAYEMTGGVLRITGTPAADTGIHLSWNAYNWVYGAENSGAFLLQGGRVETDQISLGRSDANTAYAITNAFSLFKMTGGELVLGPRGFYAGRTWNNGSEGSGYAVKLLGGTLTAGDSWSSALDLFLSDANGGTVFKTENTNGFANTVVLNGTVYGPGRLIKRGAGVLTLAGGADYSGKTQVEEGTLVVKAEPADCCRWTADSLSGTNNEPVTVWTDVNNGVPATNAVPSQMPCLIRNEINGHSAVRFSSAASQYLAVSADNSPISGATGFSIVVVFKTTTAGVGSGHWYNCTGLVDGEQGGIQNDWGLAYNSSGLVTGGAGFPAINTDTTVTSASGYSVVNGQTHVALLTWQGTNLVMNVDGRVTTAASISGTVSPRNVYRLLFGSMNFIKYFNGDMAEIRIYRNHALTADEQRQIGGELAATYGVPNAPFAVPAAVAAVAGEVAASPAPVVPDPLPYPATVWDADTLSGATGSAVTAWASTNGASVATLDAATVLDGGGAISGRTAPTLQPGAINGHHAVRFSATSRNVLGIPVAQNPLAGVTNFSVAFVFRTENPGRWDVNQQWWGCEGLIDAEQPGATYDWGITFTQDGRVAAGIGNADATVFSKPFDLHDGVPHVAVASFNATGGTVTVMVDGLPVSRNVGAHNTARNVKRLLLGAVNGEAGKFYTGDMAAVQLFPSCVLTESEMTSLSSALAMKYGIRMVGRGNALAPQSNGLGRGDVEVSAGAALVLPAAAQSAVTLASDQAIRGAGTVRGTLALDANAVIEVGQTDALTLDDLWLQNGAVVRWAHAGGAGSVLAVGTLKTSAAATLEVVGGDTLPVRVPVISYSSCEGLEGTAWTVVGCKPNTRVEINSSDRTVDLVTPQGTLISVK
ncbi:MAG: LamG-like jellyroll fold domain-containing protein [Kiritimatiellia bacterium]